MSGISPYKIRLPVGYGTPLTQYSLQSVRISSFSLSIRFIVLLILCLLKQVWLKSMHFEMWRNRLIIITIHVTTLRWFPRGFPQKVVKVTNNDEFSRAKIMCGKLREFFQLDYPPTAYTCRLFAVILSFVAWYTLVRSWSVAVLVTNSPATERIHDDC